jgi:N-acetylglucosamine-6-phosphate deacetylase
MGGSVYGARGVIDDGYVLIEQGMIVDVGQRAELRENSAWTMVDVRGARIVPGLIDLHTHGMMGQDCIDGDLALMASAFARNGVTTFLATVEAAPVAVLRQTIQRLVQFHRYQGARHIHGARLAGINLEGPFISPCRAGALDSHAFRLPSLTEVEELLHIGEGLIRVVSLAPELPGSNEVIALLAARGVIPAVGHSEASYEQVIQAVQVGLRHVTHLFNAMGPFHHRDPGVVGAALTDDRVTVEIIGDGHHLHPASVELVFRAKGLDQICLVSDSAPMTGLPEGIYHWLGQRVTVQEGKAQFDDGTLAGSIAPLNLAMHNLLSTTDHDLESLLPLMTQIPARVLGLNRGSIEVGREADLVAFDEYYTARLTMVGGAIVHNKL